MLGRLVAIASILVGFGAPRAEAQQRRELSFQDALAVTLANNGDLYLAKTDVDLAGDDLAFVKSIFDPHFVASTRESRDDEGGSSFRFPWTDTVVTGTVGLDGMISTGMTYGVGFTATAERYSDPFLDVYGPAYVTQLSATVTQPLLRGGWHAGVRQPIVVAALRRDLSEQQLRVRIEQVVGQVAVAYWELALAYKERDAGATLLKLAQDQLAESTRLSRIGTISDLDVVDARAGVEREQKQLLQAEQHIAEAEGKLRTVLVGGSDWKGDDVIVPVDDPDVAPVSYSVDEHIELARRNRPDIIAARAAITAEGAQLDATRNELLPKLDLTASAGLLGFAGTLQDTYVTDGTAPFLNSLMPAYTPDTHYEGGFGRSMENLATRGNYMISVGLKLDLPLKNHAAEAHVAHQHDMLERVRIAERALLAQVDNEVRTSIKLLESDAQIEKAADDAVAVNTQLLAGMRKRFSAGAITTFDVLRVADELARSEIDAARARVSYRISQARLATADGTLLQSYHITISALGHFARE